MRSYLSPVLDLIYPPRCPSCLKLTEDGDFCARCARLLPAIGRHICRRCGQPVPTTVDDCRDCRGRELYFDTARAAWTFEGPARDVIHAYKFANQKSLAPALARYLTPLMGSGRAIDTGLIARPDPNVLKAEAATFLITWVPLTRRKTWNRGYNQAKLLAFNLAGATGIPATALLTRVRATEDQSRLNGRARRTNIKGVFGPTESALIAGADIVLVDDVYTTGSTAAECSKTLKDAGAASIRVVTLARSMTHG